MIFSSLLKVTCLEAEGGMIESGTGSVYDQPHGVINPTSAAIVAAGRTHWVFSILRKGLSYD